MLGRFFDIWGDYDIMKKGGVCMKKEVASVVRCEDGAMNWGFQMKKRSPTLPKQNLKKSLCLSKTNISGGGIENILNS